MARIKIKDLPRDKKISKKEMTKVLGGYSAPDNSISRYEETLQTVGDDAQLANIDLQNALQKQQQTLQTMSNVSKMSHDTATAVIRKIG